MDWSLLPVANRESNQQALTGQRHYYPYQLVIGFTRASPPQRHVDLGLLGEIGLRCLAIMCKGLMVIDKGAEPARRALPLGLCTLGSVTLTGSLMSNSSLAIVVYSYACGITMLSIGKLRHRLINSAMWILECAWFAQVLFD